MTSCLGAGVLSSFTGVNMQLDIPQLTVVEAQNLTSEIRKDVEDFVSSTVPKMARAYQGRAWSVLGYSSWSDYCQMEFGTDRLKVPRAERSGVVALLRDAGMSTRAIAAATGASQDTVNRTLADERNRSPEPTEIKGTDGKTYKPRQPAVEDSDTLEGQIVSQRDSEIADAIREYSENPPPPSRAHVEALWARASSILNEISESEPFKTPQTGFFMEMTRKLANKGWFTNA